jgi:vancomycin resistance protein YoaR
MSDNPSRRPAALVARVGAAFFGLAAVAIPAVLLVAHADAGAPPPSQPSAIVFGGLHVAPDDSAQTLTERFLQTPIVLLAEDARIELTRRELGGQVDVERLRRLLAEASNPASPMRKVHALAQGAAALSLPMPATLDEAQLMPWLVRLKDVIDRAAVDARPDPRTQTVQPAQTGLAVHVHGAFARVTRALRDGDTRVVLPIVATPAERDTEALQGIAMNAVLGEYETRYDRRDKSRVQNLQAAAAHLDGYVLTPGEELAFNTVVGRRTRANGFRTAAVIANGEVADGLGGGTCQIASTLYAAAYLAGLPIPTRHPHSRPSHYTKLGLDAAVAYGSLDLRMRNDMPHPIVIEVTVEGGVVRAALHGPERTRKVTVVRSIDEALPFDERIDKDDTLPNDVRVLAQRGIPGFRLTRTRTIEDVKTGEVTEESDESAYPPTPQLWRVGTGARAPDGYVPPRNDAHREYTADKALTLIQRPGYSGTRIDRVRGRTGTPGWTVREGMVANQDG